MALERGEPDSEIHRIEAQFEQNRQRDLDEQFEYGISPDGGQGDPFSEHAVESLRQAYERAMAGPDASVLDWRTRGRPKSASYMRPRSRQTPTGGGGAPMMRPSSAPAGRQPPKTERWRESGIRRWPKESHKIHHASDTSEGDPLRRGQPNQPNWNGELWIRSLRRPGIEIQDPSYHDVAPRGMRELHEEWQSARPHMPSTPRRPHSARAGYGPRSPIPYSGSTAIGKAALPRKHDMKNWVERPVATGTMSLTHHGGKRYTFNQQGRGLEWEDYLRTVNPYST